MPFSKAADPASSHPVSACSRLAQPELPLGDQRTPPAAKQPRKERRRRIKRKVVDGKRGPVALCARHLLSAIESRIKEAQASGSPYVRVDAEALRTCMLGSRERPEGWSFVMIREMLPRVRAALQVKGSCIDRGIYGYRVLMQPRRRVRVSAAPAEAQLAMLPVAAPRERKKWSRRLTRPRLPAPRIGHARREFGGKGGFSLRSKDIPTTPNGAARLLARRAGQADTGLRSKPLPRAAELLAATAISALEELHEAAAWREAVDERGLALAVGRAAISQGLLAEDMIGLSKAAAYVAHGAWRDGMHDRCAGYFVGTLRKKILAAPLRDFAVVRARLAKERAMLALLEGECGRGGRPPAERGQAAKRRPAPPKCPPPRPKAPAPLPPAEPPSEAQWESARATLTNWLASQKA